MDGLDLLKKDWNKASVENKLSAKDIYGMLHKKSSSIVKTLFYISVAELVFWILVNTIPYFTSESYKEKLEDIYVNEFIFSGLTILSYSIILLFIFLLYRSYKSISVTDSAKKLMESILKTRKIIKYYVLYNLIMAGVSMAIGFYYAFKYNPKLSQDFATFDNMKMTIAIVTIVIFTFVFIVIIWLFYKLIYGLLLKRLNLNYTELKKLEN